MRIVKLTEKEVDNIIKTIDEIKSLLESSKKDPKETSLEKKTRVAKPNDTEIVPVVADNLINPCYNNHEMNINDVGKRKETEEQAADESRLLLFVPRSNDSET